jgi:hypothetical protein
MIFKDRDENTRKRKTYHLKKGQGLTEFALGITFMMILLAGTVDLGRALFTHISLIDAAQEGASYASIAPYDVEGIRQRVRTTSSDFIDFESFTDDQIDVQVIGWTCAGHTIKITLYFDFSFIAPFISLNILPLSAEAIDTILQPPC